MSRSLSLRVAAVAFFLFAPLLAAQGPINRKAAWAEIDKLIKEQKVETAYERLDALLPAIREGGDPKELTRALIRGAQLRAAAVEPAEAVRFLQGQPWPEDRRERAVLHVFYAKALENYYNEYRWEIWKRESVRSEEPVDVEKWTTGEVFEAASQAYLSAWKEREILGEIPVSELAEFLKPNNYPKEVRGTLRDMISYLWVDLLADTGWWSPAQSNAVRRFDLVALARNDEVVEERLADREVHPLVRALMVLSDLERWHASKGNKDGALEARLERFRQLRRHALLDEMKALRAELESILPAYRGVPWWATGMADLADLYRYSGDLAAAVRTARAGHEAWPKSPGGERCLGIAREIETPGYYLSSTSSDALNRRSIQVQHKNLPALWFRAYEIDLQQRLEKSGPLFPNLEEELLKSRPAYSWKSDLPATPDYRGHTTYIVPPIDKPGAYVVVASGRQDFAIKTAKEYLPNQLVATPLILGDLALVARRNERKELEVVTLSGSRGETVSGVEARLYEVSGDHRGLRKTGSSDAQGRLPFDLYQGYAVFARKGNDVALLLGTAYSGERDEETGTRSLIFTDRSIYRPQQKVLWKVLVYDNFGGGRFEGLAEKPVMVSLVDPNGETVESGSFTTNEFGTASGEFTIPPGRMLGSWTIETSEEGAANIRVEEYKRPTFEVTLEEPKEALRIGRPASFPGTARYYFGLPVAHGEVRWKAVRQTLSFWWWDEPGNDETVATGTVQLSPDGTFEIGFTPEGGDLKGRDPRQVSYLYRIEADLTDEGGETRSAKRSFRLGYVAIEAEITLDRDLLAAGEPAKATIMRRDLAGIARPGEATWRLVALRQPAETLTPADLPLSEEERMEKGEDFHTEGDLLRPRFHASFASFDPQAILRQWEDGDLIASGRLVHGKDGEAELTLPELAPGAYRLRYETADESGETFSTWRELIVAGDQTPLALPAVLAVDASGAKPGGRVRVLAHSGFDGQLLWLETFRNSELKERRLLRMGRDASLIEIPISKEDRGGFTLKLVTLRDHQLMELVEHVYVPWDDRRLEVEVATFRDRIRPGSHETWTVKVRPAEGEPELAGAELLAYLYDRSLDLFAPHQPADPVSLYPVYIGIGDSASSLGRSGAYGAGHGWRDYYPGPDLHGDEIPFRFAFQEPSEAPHRLGGVEGGVVGGAAPPPPPPPPPPMKPSAKLAEEVIVANEVPMEEQRGISTGATVAQSPVELRSNFAETAFWQPHLIAGPDGTAAIEFDVPDSVTSWSFWVHALTRDLRAGSLQKEVRSVKDLMVRPYVPRFLRESDTAQLEVVVNNASDGELRGTVTLDVVDPETGKSLLADFGLQPSKAHASFTAAAAGGTSVSFPLSTPKRVGPVAFKVTATAGNLSDGELRPLPVLPSRMHLMQSRFAALTSGRKELRFEDMTKSDPTRIDEQMVVTLDAQLFYSVLESVPYLVDYPYECTEQTLNRFLSTGILARVADKYPAVAAMAEEMSRRETQYETWDSVDPNRKMTLEETPWLALSRGGRDPGYDLIKVLDPRVARAQRDEALGKLQQAQLDNGAFPWWSGGQASPYMTLYLLYGFAKASEFGIEVPEEMVQNGWRYLNEWFQAEEISLKAEEKKEGEAECCRRELLVFLNYVATSYPEALGAEERQKILDYTFTHWRELSGYLKVLLALTLNRMDRPDDAKLVFDAVMDLSDTTEEEGTFWAPEKEGWLWYNDNIETHAFALLAMMEIAPEDPRRHGLVQWLFLNKQLNHWHSTKATAEVIYALVHYLEKEGQLGIRESATVRVGDQTTTFTFEPDRFTGKHNQVVVPGEKLNPKTASTVVVEKDSPALMFASATWHFSTDQLPAEARGDLFGVTRRYFLRSTAGKEAVLTPLDQGTALKPGDEVEVHLIITSRAPAEYVHLRDPRAAGLEPDGARSGYVWDWTSPSRYEETRDSGNNFFFDWLPAGEYTFKYRLRANMAGTFRVGPATLQSMYAPEFTAYSAGNVVTVAPATP